MNEQPGEPWIVGRYAVYDEIASGGMATVHVARLMGHAGFGRTVAIKRLHAHLAKDPNFSCMLVDEARLAARISHPNVLATLDVVTAGNELILVMDYVHGEPVSKLMQGPSRGEKVPPRIAAAIAIDMLYGLHAAHEARDEHGTLLGLVHRDISPHNLLVGVDGVTRVADFGVAKAAGRLQATRSGMVKGKLGYMAPEQLSNDTLSRKTDVYAAAVVIWEMLTGQHLFERESDRNTLWQSITRDPAPPSLSVEGLDKVWDEIVGQGLSRMPDGRYATARAMAQSLERAVAVARASEVGEWVEQRAGASLARRARLLAAIDAAVWSSRRTSSSRASHPSTTGAQAEANPISGEHDDGRGRSTPAGAWGVTVEPTLNVMKETLASPSGEGGWLFRASQVGGERRMESASRFADASARQEMVHDAWRTRWRRAIAVGGALLLVVSAGRFVRKLATGERFLASPEEMETLPIRTEGWPGTDAGQFVRKESVESAIGTPPSPADPSSSCVWPYTVDAWGHTVLRKECL